MSGGMPNAPLQPSGNHQMGQGGWNRESYQLEDEGLSQAKFAAEVDSEASSPERPGLFERVKRWLSARF